ncbi:colanic acid biosynthesis protein [Enterococcus casseliflavus]|uniref:polysaccharide pyruvyl transferase family protein n=1 Tax=Enterococcus casseliflavus TaxID=37734 RepID=UPI000DF8F20F|nr:polysaccharide pyruvyl transferase family protein [Enterococcus casseliflavus]GEB27115.1 colanic acid biosynthesis glycosyl transferase [Enterococcus casseliflavus]STP34212.1 colanic acid biosynthesis protein [Enterococcus casseliflavus]
MKVLIDNCVPLNNGDAALIFSLEEKISAKHEVTLCCLNYKTVKEKYPQYEWIPSYINTKFYKFSRKIPYMNILWKIVISIALLNKNNPYNRSDVIISAPGGYLHSYYGIEARMFILYFCKKILKKRVGIYSQSIGNLSLKDQKILKKYGSSLDFILTRDKTSFDRAKDYGLKENLILTKDAAFMLNTSENFVNEYKNKVIAISMRSWGNEGRDLDKYFNMMDLLVKQVLARGYSIVFISTCQGIRDYVDDSSTAKAFIKKFNYSDDNRISVDSSYYDLNQLQKKLTGYDFVIGTRLHMCILALINKVVAFNISYEEKGKECYSYLNLEDFSVDYNDQNVQEKISHFLNLDQYEREEIINRVKKISEEQFEIFKSIEKIIE